MAKLEGQNDARKIVVAQSLGLVDFGVSVHYKSLDMKYAAQSSDEELKALSETAKTYAIPERGALIYHDEKLQFLGDIYLFYRGKKIKCK